MSQSAATARVPRAARTARRAPAARPQLQLVAPVAGTRSNLPFVLLCSFVLAAGLLAVLLLNMSLSQGSYEMADLQKRAALANDQKAKLEEEIAVQGSTGSLAQQATKLGMVPGAGAIFLDLSDGKVYGVAPKDPAKDPLKLAVTTGAGASAAASGPSASSASSAPSAPSATASATPSPSVAASATGDASANGANEDGGQGTGQGSDQRSGQGSTRGTGQDTTATQGADQGR